MYLFFILLFVKNPEIIQQTELPSDQITRIALKFVSLFYRRTMRTLVLLAIKVIFNSRNVLPYLTDCPRAEQDLTRTSLDYIIGGSEARSYY